MVLCRQRKAAANDTVSMSAASSEADVDNMEIDEGNAMPVEASMHGQEGEQQSAVTKQKTGKNRKRQKGSSRRFRKQ